MKTELETNLDRLIATDTGNAGDEDGDGDAGDLFVLRCDPLPERRGRKVDPESRRFNQALHRIVRGKYDIGGITHELSVITGLTPECIRSRVDTIEYEPEPLEAEVCWTADDRKYFGKRYGRLQDPEVREFLQGLNGGQRRDPDHENPRVARRRINGKMTSESIGVSRN